MIKALKKLDLKHDLVDLASYRLPERLQVSTHDPLIMHVAYAFDQYVYQNGRIITPSPEAYTLAKRHQSNNLVNKFGKTYRDGTKLWLHRKLADVLVDCAIDLYTRHEFITVVMDGLRTLDSGELMQKNRPDLVEAKLLASAGKSAHNRALAVDSKLFIIDRHHPANTPTDLFSLVEADEHGHLDDLDMAANHRFYNGPMSDEARVNRLVRLQAWQRASVKNHLPIANLLMEFWDDRVTGSPADLWRIISVRALCIEADGNPSTNPLLRALRDNLHALNDADPSFAPTAHAMFSECWHALFNDDQLQALETLLGHGGSKPPPLVDFIFHEWLENIDDNTLEAALNVRQAILTDAL